MKLFIFDTETTGLDEAKHGLFQIAGYVISGDAVAGSIDLSCSLFYRDEVAQSALDVNGFTIEQIESFQEPRHAYAKLAEFFQKHIDIENPQDKLIPVGWNVSFDIKFLKAWMKKLDKPYDKWFDYHSIDVATLAVGPTLFKNGKEIIFPSQDTLAKKFNIEYLIAKKHTALGDSWVTLTILNRICKGL